MCAIISFRKSKTITFNRHDTKEVGNFSVSNPLDEGELHRPCGSVDQSVDGGATK
jgi:hypothetical protein